MALDQLKEWKAHAYDCLAQAEAIQRELQATNQLIANYKPEAPEASPINPEAFAKTKASTK
jgi:hypothetical protein